MSLVSTIARSANKVIRELLALAIIFGYLTLLPVISILVLSYRIVTDTINVFDLVWLIFAIITWGIQLDLFFRFDKWLCNKLGVE